MAETMEEARRLAHATESTEGAAVVFALLAVAEEIARVASVLEDVFPLDVGSHGGRPRRRFPKLSVRRA